MLRFVYSIIFYITLEKSQIIVWVSLYEYDVITMFKYFLGIITYTITLLLY